jgi:hypothetical protein
MRRSRFSLSSWFLLALALFSGLLVAAAMMSVAQAHSNAQIGPQDSPGGIRGVVYDSGGSPVEGAWVDIHDLEGNPWMGTASAPDGGYSIANLPPGLYVLLAHPPPGHPDASALPAIVAVSSGQWTEQDLDLTEVRIAGYVRDCDAIPEQRIAGAAVVAHTPDWSVERWSGTNINGEFKIGGLQTGVPYLVEALPPEGSEYVPLPPVEVVPISTGVILELCIPPTNVEGIVNDYLGAPVPGAGVVVFREDFWVETAADETGAFLFRGLPTGMLTIQAGPPWGTRGEGLLASEPVTFVLPTSTTLVSGMVLTLPKANKMVTGHVYAIETTDPVTDAMVVGHRLDEPGYADVSVDAEGMYTLSLPAGEWHLSAQSLPWPAPPAPWVFPGPPAWIVFHEPYSITESIGDVNLEVNPTNANVRGNIVCPGGPCAGFPELNHLDVWVELRNDDIRTGVHPDASYEFDIPIPDGWYELVVHVEHPLLQGPEPMPVFVGPHQTITVDPIGLWPKDAKIIGMVQDELGIGVPGVHVFGWQPHGYGWGGAETDASGVYTMHVIPGEWSVEPHPGPDLPFVYRHRPALVHVAPGGTMAGIDFRLSRADARIEGIAIDAHAPVPERLWGLDGWVTAHMLPSEVFFSDAPLRDGGFGLKARGGYNYAVGLHLPPHAPYVSGGVAPVPVGFGELVTLAVPLEHKNAVIEGQLINAGAVPPEPAFGVWAEVFGEDGAGHWAGIHVDPASAWYELAVVAGTWELHTWVDPESGYVMVPTTTVVTVQSEQVVRQDFLVWPIAAHIRGEVQDPAGGTVPGAFVFAEGHSPFVGYFETFAETNELGQFDLVVPEGEYFVGAGLPRHVLEANGWLPPPPLEGVMTTAPVPAEGLVLRFRELDGEIMGTIDFATGLDVTPTHPAFVWGWAESGEWMEAEGEVVAGTQTFTYSMPVVSGTIWHIGAVYDDWDNGLYYESAEQLVDLRSTAVAAQDLTLHGPYLLPQPFIVSFDGSQMQTIVLPDGLELTIPPGALVVSGTVTLFIFPTQEMRPEPGHEVIGVGYEIWAVNGDGQEITQFNQNVIMTFHYPPDSQLAVVGVLESKLVPVYYSTLVGNWILADSYVVDTVHNEIVLQINHFTKFGLASAEPREYFVYLPAVLRNYQP